MKYFFLAGLFTGSQVFRGLSVCLRTGIKLLQPEHIPILASFDRHRGHMVEVRRRAQPNTRTFYQQRSQAILTR